MTVQYMESMIGRVSMEEIIPLTKISDADKNYLLKQENNFYLYNHENNNDSFSEILGV